LVPHELSHVGFIECELTHVRDIFIVWGGNGQNHMGKKAVFLFI